MEYLNFLDVRVLSADAFKIGIKGFRNALFLQVQVFLMVVDRDNNPFFSSIGNQADGRSARKRVGGKHCITKKGIQNQAFPSGILSYEIQLIRYLSNQEPKRIKGLPITRILGLGSKFFIKVWIF